MYQPLGTTQTDPRANATTSFGRSRLVWPPGYAESERPPSRRHRARSPRRSQCPKHNITTRVRSFLVRSCDTRWCRVQRLVQANGRKPTMNNLSSSPLGTRPVGTPPRRQVARRGTQVTASGPIGPPTKSGLVRLRVCALTVRAHATPTRRPATPREAYTKSRGRPGWIASKYITPLKNGHAARKALKSPVLVRGNVVLVTSRGCQSMYAQRHHREFHPARDSRKPRSTISQGNPGMS